MVNLLLRAGADETLLDGAGNSAADMVEWGQDNDDDEWVEDEADGVRQLLANAPADRAWRRRGYLVMCRAYPDRMQLVPEGSSGNASVARRTRARAKLTTTETSSGSGGTADDRGGGDWTDVVARVVGLQEEGTFRVIVG